MFRIAVFVSGRGSNFLSLYESLKSKKCDAEIVSVIADRECNAIEKAKHLGISHYFVSFKPKKNFVTFDELKNLLLFNKIDLIVLAGFLRKIPDDFVDAFSNKIINIHPALLPLYGGKGMYGMNVHKAVFEAKEKYSGVTVHVVDEIYDHGRILAQRKVNISGAKSPEEIAQLVLQTEHKLLPETVKKIIKGEIKLNA